MARRTLASSGARSLAGVEPGADWFARGHTNQLVPFYAVGPGASEFQARSTEEDIVWGPYMDITDHGNVIFDLLGE